MKTTSATKPTTACSCGPHQLCLACAPEEMTTLVQLKMSFHWARSPRELRERMNAHEHLSATAQNN